MHLKKRESAIFILYLYYVFHLIALFVMYVAIFSEQIRPNIQDHNYSKTLLNTPPQYKRGGLR